MATDLARLEEGALVVPGTGEIISLADPAACARALDHVRDYKSRVQEVIGTLEAALVKESERQGTRTLRYGHLTASITAGNETVWDVEALREGMQEAGLPDDRLAQLIVETVEYKVVATVANQLAKANPGYAAVIERCKTVTPKKPSASVKADPRFDR